MVMIVKDGSIVDACLEAVCNIYSVYISMQVDDWIRRKLFAVVYQFCCHLEGKYMVILEGPQSIFNIPIHPWDSTSSVKKAISLFPLQF